MVPVPVFLIQTCPHTHLSHFSETMTYCSLASARPSATDRRRASAFFRASATQAGSRRWPAQVPQPGSWPGTSSCRQGEWWWANLIQAKKKSNPRPFLCKCPSLHRPLNST